MTFVAPDRVSKWETQGFKIVKVQGHGEKSEFYRVCDTVIRNSRLFRNLCVKIFDKSRRAGVSEKYRLMWKQRQQEQEREFKAFIAFSNSTIGKLQKKVAKLEEQLEKLKSVHKVTQENLYKQTRYYKRAIQNNSQLEKEASLFINHNRFFTQPLYARDVKKYLPVRSEFFLRAIITFRQYEEKGEISYPEFLILATGTHLKAFNKTDLVNRFGDKVHNWFKRNIEKMMEQGYVKRFERKNMYYLTDEGREKLRHLMRCAVGIKMNTYWGDTFNDIKIAKRKLPA